MSDKALQPVHQTIVIQQAPSNGLGTSGFVISLIGFLTCGLLCPLGLLLSFFGLFKPPRGQAIAGTILGSLGSLWLFVFGIAILAPIFLPSIRAASHAATKMQEANREKKARLESQTEPVRQDTTVATDVLAPDTSKGGAANVNAVETQPQTLDAQPDTIVNSAPAKPAAPLDDRSARDDEQEFRTWHNDTGKFSVEAKFIKQSMGTVTLEKRDGKRIQLPMAQLSGDDRKYIRKRGT